MKWQFTKTTDVKVWKEEMISEPERVGRSILLDISFSGEPVEPVHLAKYIEQVYGEKAVKEVHFANNFTALVMFENPDIFDDLATKFKSCMFPHIKSAEDTENPSYVRFDVYVIFPMLAITHILLKDAKVLKSYPAKELDQVSILGKVLRLMHPHIGPNKFTEDEDSDDIRVRFITSNLQLCWDTFAKSPRSVTMHNKVFDIVYLYSEPAKKVEHVFPAVDIEGYMEVGW